MSDECGMPSLVTKEDVMFFDTDCGGVVHNLAYLRMIEINRTKLGAKMGLDMKRMSEEQLFAVVVRTEADYIRPGKLGDVLRIEGRLAEVGRSTLKFAFEMFREVDDTLLLKVRQTLALVQMPEGKPRRTPQEWRDKWNSCP